MFNICQVALAAGSIAALALDTNQSYGMCLDVKDSVDKVVLEPKGPAPNPFDY